jgi:holo-[acyl-carrier protein] synthase
MAMLHPDRMSIKGVGIDLARITRMREVVERWDERFLRRVFTDGEIAYCRQRRDPIPHLAARFAAKEATLKALGTGLRMGLSWTEMEVRRERDEAPTMVLSGRCRAVALSRGAHRVLLSLSHDGDYALAQALLVQDVPGDEAPRS